jgi:cytochrome c biogenesis factor
MSKTSLFKNLPLRNIAGCAVAVCGLVAAGFVLQFVFGGFDISLLARPVNIVLGCATILVCVGAALLPDNRWVRWISGLPMAVTLMAALGLLALVMGLTPQGAMPVGGLSRVSAMLGFNAMTSSWSFVLVYFALLLSLGAIVARRLAVFRLRDWAFVLNHAGLWLILFAAGLGGADVERYRMRIDEGASESRGQETATGHPRELPLTVRLRDFVMEEYAPRSPGARPEPKSYTSDIEVTTSEGVTLNGVTTVNHPLRIDGWFIYQYGYDREAGPESGYTILELVRDPWLMLVYAGFAMIALGVLSMVWRGRRVLAVTALAAGVVWLFVHLSKGDAPPRNLVPALQSVWFVPHVVSYILSYAMLGAATVGSFFQLRRLAKHGMGDAKTARWIDNLVYAGFGFLVLGMSMGAVWAKQAWGHYWEWDPKETWALVTTLAYLVYIHLRLMGSKYEKSALWLLPVAFVLLLITWLGVNYLPSAQSSIHVY